MSNSKKYLNKTAIINLKNKSKVLANNLNLNDCSVKKFIFESFNCEKFIKKQRY